MEGSPREAHTSGGQNVQAGYLPGKHSPRGGLNLGLTLIVSSFWAQLQEHTDRSQLWSTLEPLIVFCSLHL
ncbi:hypothetical protein XELAEV_18020078mg [Xenopus laevis]|uniref:Uncharacterized protein n=1 Tax=Xenopus laevis TaxID=8355 RepID=A0A974D8Q2_XENLA|nr:hypothetical protein XELAEV_18020078mg [Xenopus laevis]